MTRGLGLRTALGERGSQPVGIWTSNGQQEVKEERRGGSEAAVASGALYGLSTHSVSKGLCNEDLGGRGMTFRL